MVILHDAIKTIQNGFLSFFLKKRTKTCFFQNNKKFGLKKQAGCCFFLKTGFPQR